MPASGRPLRILYVEPFAAGSHAEFGRVLMSGVGAEWTALTLPGRHWKWRMRSAAAHLALAHRDALLRGHDVLLASSFLALAELRGLVPSLAAVPSLLYFHENQLAYPAQGGRDEPRDLHFGFTQLVSALAATRCAFNSTWNRDSFLVQARDVMRRMPDARPPGWIDQIEGKSEVLPIPLDLPDPPAAFEDADDGSERQLGPILLWNHRWEHDKDPEAFFRALHALVARGVAFRVAVCGESFERAPPIFAEARAWLGARVVHWGYAPSRRDYWSLLRRAHVAVSTARHEFFGAAMLEATHAGAYPLVPDRLAYPEHFPAPYRYGEEAELLERLTALCAAWTRGEGALRADRRHISQVYAAPAVLPRFAALLESMSAL